MLNARIRKRWLAGGFPVGVIGEAVDLTYPHTHLGAGPETLQDVADGKHSFAKTLADAERPMLILGQGALARPDGAAVLALARHVAEETGMVGKDWNGFNVLHTAAARVGGLDLGFVPGKGGKDVAGILAGAESGDDQAGLPARRRRDRHGAAGRAGKGAFVVYQGHHGDEGAHRADVILPGAAYTEKHGTYVNTEGRPQRGLLAVFPPGEAREDWAIVRALSDVLGHKLPYDNLLQLRARLAEANKIFAAIDEVAPARWGKFGKAGDLDAAPFRSTIENFYMTDPITRCSEIMAQCTDLRRTFDDGRTGTEG